MTESTITATPDSSGPTGPAGDKQPYLVRSVVRAATILRAFTPDARRLALAEIARRTGLDKGTARRLLVTLKAVGLIEQDPSTQRYALAPAVLELGGAVPHLSDLSDIAKDALSDLAQATGATVFLSTKRDTKAICLGRYLSDTAIQVRWWDVGGTRPMNCGGAPRLLLAMAPESEWERVIADGLTSFTAKSRTDPDALRSDLHAIRARGWELSIDDVVEGLAAAAVPVRDRAGTTVAAISVAGLTQHVVTDGAPRFLDAMAAAADNIEARLG